MIKTTSKASSKAISAASKLSGQQFGKSTGWQTVFEILSDGFIWDIHTKTREQITEIKVYKEETKDPIEKFSFANSDVFESGDWNWNYIYRIMVEWLLENRKKHIKKPRKNARKTKN